MAATALARGVYCCAVSYIFSFDTIFIHCKEEANQCGGSAGGRGGFGGLGGFGSHEELDVANVKGGGNCVCSTRTVFSGSEEEEESDPVKVCNCSSSRRAALGD